MTDPITLLALAERCEQAAGPDKELDFTIDNFMLKHGPEADRIRNPRYVLPYTTSLDAAVTLVPEGWRWWVNSSPFGRCWLVANDQIADKAQSEKCATPALALCAAALRARATMSQPSSDI